MFGIIFSKSAQGIFPAVSTAVCMPFSAEWNITGKSQPSYSNVNAYMTYETERANAYKILEDTLNLCDVCIYDTVTGDGFPMLKSGTTTIPVQEMCSGSRSFRGGAVCKVVPNCKR